jgi:hypothetical protein
MKDKELRTFCWSNLRNYLFWFSGDIILFPDEYNSNLKNILSPSKDKVFMRRIKKEKETERNWAHEKELQTFHGSDPK